MSKSAFVEMVEKDMDSEADWVVKDLCDYAEKNLIDGEFVIEAFLKAFRKKTDMGDN